MRETKGCNQVADLLSLRLTCFLVRFAYAEEAGDENPTMNIVNDDHSTHTEHGTEADGVNRSVFASSFVWG